MSFGKDIRKAVNEKYKPGLFQVTWASLVQLSTSIVIGTPVLSGRARGNWFAAIDVPQDGTTESTSVNFAKIEGIAVESVGSVFYLTNNLPYIKPLEFLGHSKQAPDGMVRIAIENYQKFLDNAISQLT